MKQYDHFGEYMFDLLFAPLKKGKQAVNQFYIFFKVIGRIFDNLKADALRVREETNVATASSAMLPVHGQDRNMPRLAGESIEGYRTRLAMKAIISRWSGTRKGILYALTALGYEQSYIEPFYEQDPKRWAEFVVHLKVRNASTIKNLYGIDSEIQKVKEASSKIACFIATFEEITCSLNLSGVMASVMWLPLPELSDNFNFENTSYAGGSLGMRIVLPLPRI